MLCIGAGFEGGYAADTGLAAVRKKRPKNPNAGAAAKSEKKTALSLRADTQSVVSGSVVSAPLTACGRPRMAAAAVGSPPRVEMNRPGCWSHLGSG